MLLALPVTVCTKCWRLFPTTHKNKTFFLHSGIKLWFRPLKQYCNLRELFVVLTPLSMMSTFIFSVSFVRRKQDFFYVSSLIKLCGFITCSCLLQTCIDAFIHVLMQSVQYFLIKQPKWNAMI